MAFESQIFKSRSGKSIVIYSQGMVEWIIRSVHRVYSVRNSGRYAPSYDLNIESNDFNLFL